MRIVEIGDYSMVIMKDSDDPPWFSVGEVYRWAQTWGDTIIVEKRLGIRKIEVRRAASSSIYTAGRLILFFQDTVVPDFCLNDRIYVHTEYASEYSKPSVSDIRRKFNIKGQAD